MFTALNRSPSAERRRPFRVVADHCVDPQDASPFDENARGRVLRPNTQTTVLSTTFPFWVQSDNEEETSSEAEELAITEPQTLWESPSFHTYPVWSSTLADHAESDGEDDTSSDKDSERSPSSERSWEDSSSPTQSRVGEKRKRGESPSPRSRKRFILPAFLNVGTSPIATHTSEWLSEADSGAEDERSKDYEDSEEPQNWEEARSEGYESSEENENSGSEDGGADDSEYDAQGENPSPVKNRAIQRSSDGGSGDLKDRRYWCFICLKDFRNAGGIKRHMESLIHMEAHHPCYICNRKYQRADVLKKHMLKLHGVR
ncbi:hypothetical protein HYPSUDRAFT_201889 [Hypholoma sublateritium FD-334 SS-4]|uniref:C2H2-type domain-containing protein n=1 Tax=Hypholoma sublateritium (strain FD-334 SS-4) TaxID=945553 RepID=A0A0D2MGQ1_HYPSF|nr:hypothetical protein HYPSUDRAFT_201889 [Hypholoma sublateritium FD-334 SS-4]